MTIPPPVAMLIGKGRRRAWRGARESEGKKHAMRITIRDDFDLEKIAESGQCFRWTGMEDGSWRILAADRCVYASGLGGETYALDCDENAFRSFWYAYFDLGESYRTIRERVSMAEDPFLRTAAENERGIRILRQDAWEMLISFIISQNRNIPAIRKSVELLCEACGEKRVDTRGLAYYAFPTPARLAGLGEEQRMACRLGYRWKYVQAAARSVSRGEIDFGRLREAAPEEAMRELTALYGVGEKVASCVALFGLHQTDAFPRDVWIRKVLANEYPAGYPFGRYSPWNGVYQQYMFAYYRNRKQEKNNV